MVLLSQRFSVSSNSLEYKCADVETITTDLISCKAKTKGELKCGESGADRQRHFSCTSTVTP